MKQELVWMEWEPSDTFAGGKFKSIIIKQRPKRVWTLFEIDPNKKPLLPILPEHNKNAFIEDCIHDWDYINGQGMFKYYTRIIDQSVWVLLEFDND